MNDLDRLEEQLESELLLSSLEQIVVEDTLSKNNILAKIAGDIHSSDSLKPYIDTATKLAYEYADRIYYESKEIRVDTLNYDIPVDAIIAIMAQYPNIVPIHAACAQIATYMPHEDIFDAIKTAAELITVMAESDLWDVYRANTDTDTSVSIKCNFTLDKATQRYIHNTMYLPPLSVIPKELTCNYDNGYLVTEGNAILNGGIHNDKISLDVLNMLNSTPLSIDEYMLNYAEDTPTKITSMPEGVNKIQAIANFNNMLIESEAVYAKIIDEDNTFYFNWRFDTRGRFYSSGYHVNIQGSKYKRSLVNFKYKGRITELGAKYLKIDVANCYGLDKCTFEERVDWVNEHLPGLENSIHLADETYSYIKAVNALREYELGYESGHIMALDACSSMIQIMSVLAGDPVGARNSGLISSNERADFYSIVTCAMNEKLGVKITIPRKTIKECTIPVMYGSTNKPKEVFGEDTDEYSAYYDALIECAPGAIEVMGILQSCWQSNADEHVWTLPDGHVVRVGVYDQVSKKIEIDELGSSFTYIANVKGPMNKGISLLANAIQSIDAYIAREMVRLAAYQGFSILCNHDAFVALPNNMDKVRANYKRIMIDIANSDLLNSICSEITGNTYTTEKYVNNLGELMADAEYMLS